MRRPEISGRTPAHITLRVRMGVPSLRGRPFVRAFQESLALACDRGDFQVVHYSVQRDHVHLIVEAEGKEALGRGMKSVSARLARAVNRVFGLSGAALAGRYHLRWLRSPREVRNALAYVLLNVRKHWLKRTGAPPPQRLDAASSGRWFDGWLRWPADRGGSWGARASTKAVAPARTWLLRIGWRHWRLVDPAEVPG